MVVWFEVLSSFLVLFSWLVVDYFFVQYFGKYDKGVVSLVEFFIVIVFIGFLFDIFLVISDWLVLFLSFFLGIVSSFFVKFIFLLFFKRFRSDSLIGSKSFKIKLIRSMKVERISNKRIERVFKRCNLDVKNFLKYF